MENKLLEKLAELEHQQWQHWTTYFLENLSYQNINHWREQLKDYHPELEKFEQHTFINTDKVREAIKKLKYNFCICGNNKEICGSCSIIDDIFGTRLTEDLE